MRQPGVDTYRVNGDLGSICVPHAYIPKSGCAAHVGVTTSKSSRELSVPETNQYARELDAFAQACAGNVDCGRVGNGLRNGNNPDHESGDEVIAQVVPTITAKYAKDRYVTGPPDRLL